MSDDVKVRMKVKFVDGSEENYTFPRQSTDEFQVAKYMKEALGAQFVCVELEEKLQLLPVNNILSIEVTPPPVKLPSHTIRGGILSL